MSPVMITHIYSDKYRYWQYVVCAKHSLQANYLKVEAWCIDSLLSVQQVMCIFISIHIVFHVVNAK